MSHCSKPSMEAKGVSERKWKKHMVEKRRRTRINLALHELKELALEYFDKDASKYDKMEKADILDMTVQYLERVHDQVSLRRNPISGGLCDSGSSLRVSAPIRPTAISAACASDLSDVSNNIVLTPTLASWSAFNESSSRPLDITTGPPTPGVATVPLPTDVTSVSSQLYGRCASSSLQAPSPCTRGCCHNQHMSPKIGFRPPNRKKMSPNDIFPPIIKPLAVHATCLLSPGDSSRPSTVASFECKSQEIHKPTTTSASGDCSILSSGITSGFTQRSSPQTVVPY